MHRFFARRVCLGLIAFGCGSPGDLDRSRFPDLDDTGYPDRVGAAGAGAGGSAGSGSGGGVGGTAGVGGAGGTGGQSGSGGQAGSTGQGGTGQGGTGAQTGVCPDDITVLFNRPAMQGGCAGDLCHIPGRTAPDLTSPGVESRVLGVMSTCNGRPYVGANDSFLEDKITGAPPACGEPMPFFAAAQLSAADEACILEWIDEISGAM